MDKYPGAAHYLCGREDVIGTWVDLSRPTIEVNSPLSTSQK